MTEKNNATCSICDKPYHKCLSCKDSMALRPWQIHTCSSAHYQVFQILRGLSTGVYNENEAKEKFKNVDLSDLNIFRPHIKKVIKDILKENEKSIEGMDKPVYSRKRNLKVEAEAEADIK